MSEEKKTDHEKPKNGSVVTGSSEVNIMAPDRSGERPENVSMTSVQSTDDAGGNQKTTRRPRMKAILQKLQNQVEFYFGDANITKDRFLKQKMAEDPEGYIPVSVIASFNKMKSLTTDISLVTQAMERSPLLQLSADRESVRRVTPLPSVSEQEVNSRTIYVENLPSKADHKRLSSLFSSFGIVTYVSLPRHKISNAIKGFAFIEFSSSEEAEKALEFFKSDEAEETQDDNEAMADLSTSDPPAEDSVFLATKSIAEATSTKETDPTGTSDDAGIVPSVNDSGGLPTVEASSDGGVIMPSSGPGSVVPAEDTSSNVKSVVETLTASNIIEPEVVSGATCSSTELVSMSLKRKRESDDEEGELRHKSKKETTTDIKSTALNKEISRDQSTSDSTSKTAATAIIPGNESSEKLSYKRERDSEAETSGTQPAKKMKVNEKDDSVQSQDTVPAVLKEKSEVSSDEGDQSTLTRLNSTVLSEISVAEEGEGEGEGEKKKKKRTRKHKKRKLSTAQYLKTLQLKAMSKEKWLEMKSLFKRVEKDHMKALKGDVLQKDDNDDDAQNQTHNKGFVSKCLVKITCSNEDTTIEQLKTCCSVYGPVAYVDYKTGATEGYVRFRESGCVEKLMKAEEKLLEGVTFEAVNEEEEREYFFQTQAARKQHFSKRKRKMTRGHDKLISKALKKSNVSGGDKRDKPPKPTSTHIHFSDNDE